MGAKQVGAEKDKNLLGWLNFCMDVDGTFKLCWFVQRHVMVTKILIAAI